MTWIDWVIAAFALFAALQGLKRGLLAAVIGIVAVFASYLIASAWYRSLGDAIERTVRFTPAWGDTVAFGGLFLLVYDLVAILTVMAFGGERLPLPSRVSGAVLGFVRGTMLAAALLIIAAAAPFGDPIRRDLERSTVAPVALAVYRGGLRAVAALLPSTAKPFGLEPGTF
ncbi:MAG: CvpA family protein [Armatimonadota bacterium]|nr:CvpA family protein [Armatimonadota bacterium]MDR7452287.1 CvpA family protein [Armatimonadota bacterium]MDR7467949.1 CvpA family protein [Armatimonadota bacterium]MDR7494791.1 CvpA family protein [Armatimonadota bacterium]MDR7499254.1 CvpA family protein [Armatimonadota bacterium]